MSATLRLTLALLALALPGGWLLHRTYVAELAGLEFDEALVPRRLEDWRTSSEESLDAEVESVLEPELYVWRRYERPDGLSLWAFVSFYDADDTLGAGAHDPSICYPSQGWELADGRDVQIPVAGGESLRARRLHAERDGRRDVVLFWFQPVDRWPGRPELEQLLRVYDAVRGTPQYAFVRLSGPDLQGRDVVGAVEDFAGQFAPHVRRTLEGARSTVR